MEKMKAHFKDVVPYEDKHHLERHFESRNDADETIAGIQFDDSLKGQNRLPEKLEILIRFPAELSYQKRQSWKTYNMFDTALTIDKHRYIEESKPKNPSISGSNGDIFFYQNHS